MNIEGFLLGAGFALIVVLSGWSSQITSKRKETRELEREFLGKAKIKNKEYKKIVDKKNFTKDSFFLLIDFIYSETEEENIELFEKIKKIKEKIPKLNKKYSNRFWTLVFFSISLFITGGFSYFSPENYKVIAFIPNIVFIIIIFFNLISTYILENKYNGEISEAIEDL